MIFVKYRGRLGNNLFQWAFGCVLSKLSGAPMCAPPIPLFPNTVGHFQEVPKEVTTVLPVRCGHVDIREWVAKAQGEDILVQGWPHNTAFYEPHRDWLPKALTPSPGKFAQGGESDVVLHVRWGDYFNRYRNVFGYPLKSIYNLLSTLDYDHCLIVTDTPNNELARTVIQDYRGILVAEDVPHDYRTLYHSSRLIMSPSTFSWWAAWTGNAKEIYQPYEMGFWKKRNGFALDLVGPSVKRFNSEGDIVFV